MPAAVFLSVLRSPTPRAARIHPVGLLTRTFRSLNIEAAPSRSPNGRLSPKAAPTTCIQCRLAFGLRFPCSSGAALAGTGVSHRTSYEIVGRGADPPPGFILLHSAPFVKSAGREIIRKQRRGGAVTHPPPYGAAGGRPEQSESAKDEQRRAKNQKPLRRAASCRLFTSAPPAPSPGRSWGRAPRPSPP